MSRIDGRIERGDIKSALIAMVAIIVCLTIAGGSLELIAIKIGLSSGPMSEQGLLWGFALGGILGPLAAVTRILVDVLAGTRTRPSPAEPTYAENPDHEDDLWGVDTKESNPPMPGYSDHMGIKIEVKDSAYPNKIMYALLLENEIREVAIGILRKVAYDIIRRGKPFSKRQAARHLGENAMIDTRDELVRLGILSIAGKSKNAGYWVTSTGRMFFRIMLENQIPDPIIINVGEEAKYV